MSASTERAGKPVTTATGSPPAAAATDTASADKAGNRQPPLFKGGLADWALFLLAIFSAGLLTWPVFFKVSAEQMLWIRVIDSTVCAIFAAEFFLHWRQAGWGWAYLGRNWYAFLAMVPVAHPAIIANPWVSLPLVFARVARAIDRILGSGFVFRLLTRVKDLIIDSISGAITVAVLDEVADVLVKGTYTRNIARALEENQDDLRAMVREKLRDDPQTGRFKRLPFYDQMVESVIDAVLRVTEQVLLDPRTDELVADMLRENIEQIRRAVDAQDKARQ